MEFVFNRFTPNTVTALTSPGRVTRLHNKVLYISEKQAVVVISTRTQSQEVLQKHKINNTTKSMNSVLLLLQFNTTDTAARPRWDKQTQFSPLGRKLTIISPLLHKKQLTSQVFGHKSQCNSILMSPTVVCNVTDIYNKVSPIKE